jgi:hypothetical protein
MIRQDLLQQPRFAAHPLRACRNKGSRGRGSHFIDLFLDILLFDLFLDGLLPFFFPCISWLVLLEDPYLEGRKALHGAPVHIVGWDSPAEAKFQADLSEGNPFHGLGDLLQRRHDGAFFAAGPEQGQQNHESRQKGSSHQRINRLRSSSSRMSLICFWT